MAKDYKALPSCEELWELFDYKPLTGELVRRSSRGGQFAGTVACVSHPDGYRRVKVRRAAYTAQRIVWRWVTSEDPGALQVDHKDRNRSNNACNNLRLVTHGQNQWNRAGTSRCGVKGVTALSDTKFVARIRRGGVVRFLGYYKTAEEAGAAYVAAGGIP